MRRSDGSNAELLRFSSPAYRMSLLTFFSEQRRAWCNQTKDWPAEHVGGGLAALSKAEVTFMAKPLYNVHLQLVKAQQELEEISYKSDQYRKLHELRLAQLATATQAHKDHRLAYKQLEKRAGHARRTLERLAKVAALDEFEPEVRLRYLQELLKQFFAQAPAEETEDEDAAPAEE